MPLEQPGQFGPPPVQPRFHRALRNVQNRRNFFIVQLLEIPQNHRLPQLRRQLLQRGLQQLTRLPPRQQTVRPSPLSRRPRLDHRQLILNRIRHPVRLRPPVMINQQVPRHPREPHRKRTLAGAKQPQRLEQPEKNLLRQILRFAVGSRKPITNRIHPARVRPDEILPRRLFAGQTALHQP